MGLWVLIHSVIRCGGVNSSKNRAPGQVSFRNTWPSQHTEIYPSLPTLANSRRHGQMERRGSVVCPQLHPQRTATLLYIAAVFLAATSWTTRLMMRLSLSPHTCLHAS